MFWNIISLGYVTYSILILSYVFIYYRERFLQLLFGLLVGQLLIKYFHTFTCHKELRRPVGACNCNLWNTGDNYEQRGGMPSGHVTMTTYLWLSLWFITGNTIFLEIGLIAIISMGLSRYYKKCHTPLQIMAGMLLGTLLACIIYT